MTKPSYEERLIALGKWCVSEFSDSSDSPANIVTADDGLGAISDTLSEARAENLRVRGLLQRVNVLSSRLWSMAQGMDEGGDVEELALQLETLAEQAESADIGKLDSAEKCQRCGHALVVSGGVPVCKWHGIWHRNETAGAETGGEKAAPEKSAEEWAINVRERYDPIGQEGFISLSMALFAKELDMYRNQSSSGPREPEKLNNSQKCTCTNEMGLRYRNAYHEKICLAESSLSKTIDTTGENPSF